MERMTENEIDESSTAEVFSVVQIEGKREVASRPAFSSSRILPIYRHFPALSQD